MYCFHFLLLLCCSYISKLMEASTRTWRVGRLTFALHHSALLFGYTIHMYNTYIMFYYLMLLPSQRYVFATVRNNCIFWRTYPRIISFGCKSCDEAVTFGCCIPIHWIIDFRENQLNKCIQLSITIIQSVYNRTNWIPLLNPASAWNVINWII